MSFGPCGASGTFTRLLDNLFRHVKWKQVIYLDDVIVISNSFEEHLLRVQNVFDIDITAREVSFWSKRR